MPYKAKIFILPIINQMRTYRIYLILQTWTEVCSSCQLLINTKLHIWILILAETASLSILLQRSWASETSRNSIHGRSWASSTAQENPLILPPRKENCIGRISDTLYRIFHGLDCNLFCFNCAGVANSRLQYILSIMKQSHGQDWFAR